MTHYCYEMLKGYAALQRFTPKRDPRSIEINCEDDLIRHYDRGRGDTYAGVLQEKYLTQDNSTCLRPPSAGVGEPPPPCGCCEPCGSHAGRRVALGAARSAGVGWRLQRHQAAMPRIARPRGQRRGGGLRQGHAAARALRAV